MELDYQKLKFKSGLEIHQQLDANGRKLFCDCPAVLRNDEPDFSVERKLHVVAGESGEIDPAALYASGAIVSGGKIVRCAEDKTFVYSGHKENSCLIELDEEPPHEVNSEALKIAVQVALFLNCKIFPIAQIMRKTVVDGSNTSGFQRTVLIARDGYIETSLGKVGIDTICLEEDSARKIREEGNKIYWGLDRLGIPLVEIATAPDIKNPEQAKECALKLGDVLRSCKVKRGIGTIRQDVNISIRDENRVELKGMQDMKTFLKTIENEVLRQKELSDKKTPTEAEVRNALNDKDCRTEFLRPMPGADRMYPETDLPLLKISRDFINECKKDLPKLRSEIFSEFEKKGLNEEMTKLLFKQNKVDDFRNLTGFYRDVGFIAKMILLFPKEISKKLNKSFGEVDEIVMDNAGDILRNLDKRKISEGDIKDVLVKIVNGESLKDALNVEKKDLSEVEEKILKIIKEKPGLSEKAYMGLVMGEFKGQVGGKEVMGIIGKLLK